MTTFDSRATLKLRAARRSSGLSASGSVFHFVGNDLKLLGKPHSECQRVWRGIQNYHLDSKDWSDIAYSVGACYHDVILAGRGKGVRTAANGTNTANGKYHAVCALTGPNDPVTDELLTAMLAAAKMLGGGKILGHTDVKTTHCPGNKLQRWINAGAQAPSEPAKTNSTGGNEMARKEPQDWAKPSWDKAMAARVFSEHTNADDVITAEKLAVLLNRAGVLDPDSPSGQHSHPLTEGEVMLTWPTRTGGA